MKVFLVSVLLVATALAAPGVTDNRIDSIEESELKLSKIFGNCIQSSDMVSCLAVKGITAMNRAAKSNNIEIGPGIVFTRDQSVSVREGKSMTESDVLSSLPKDSEEKTNQLVDMAIDSITSFLSSHNLQVKIPSETTQEIARSLEEGRGKMKKMMGPLMMAIGAKLVAIIPIILGGLALLATKALVVAKIAFLLAIALGATKLFGGASLGKISGAGQSGWSGNTGWSGGVSQGWSNGGSYPYARSIDAHEMAYNAQVPESSDN